MVKNCNITEIMKAESIIKIRKTLENADRITLKKLCLRLAKFKIENKELLTYLLYESSEEDEYVKKIKYSINNMFCEINTDNYFYIKKSVRKILRRIRRFSKYSNQPETEIELLIYFCNKMINLKPSIFNNKTLTNILIRTIDLSKKKNFKLHEDLQYEYNIKIQELKDKI